MGTVNKILFRLVPDPTTPRGQTRWLRFGVIFGVFLVAVFFAVRAGEMINPLEIFSERLILLFPALVGALLLLRWPMAGLMALVGGSLVVPFAIGTGTQTSINFAILMVVGITGLWLFDGIATKRPGWLYMPRPVLPFLILGIIATLAFLVGQLPWFTFASQAGLFAQAGGLGVFWLSAAAFTVTANQLRSLRVLEWMVWLYLGLGSLYVFGQIAGQLIPAIAVLSNRILQRGVYDHSVFWIWMAALSFSQAVFNHRLKPLARAALLAVLAGTLYVSLVLFSSWTSGWLPAGAAIGIILVVSGSRWAWFSLLIGAGSLALKADSIRRLLYSGDNTYSLMTRLEAWKIVGQIVKVNPLLGLGPANYYWYTPLYPILGYFVQFNSHNNYVDLIAQVGILGLLAFLWLAFEIGWLGMKLRDQVPDGFARAYVYGALGGLGAMLIAGMLGDWFLPFIYNVGLSGFRASALGWVFLGGMLALGRMIRGETADREQVAS